MINFLKDLLKNAAPDLTEQIAIKVVLILNRQKKTNLK